jgi:hypothetical protein
MSDSINPGAKRPLGGSKELRNGLVTAFQSKSVDPFPVQMSVIFAKAGLSLRMSLLNCLLKSVGPLALAVVCGGSFARYLERTRWKEVSVSVDEAAGISAGHIQELARYVEQSNPHIIEQVAGILSQDVMALTVLSASLLAIAVQTLERRSRETKSGG